MHSHPTVGAQSLGNQARKITDSPNIRYDTVLHDDAGRVMAVHVRYTVARY